MGAPETARASPAIPAPRVTRLRRCHPLKPHEGRACRPNAGGIFGGSSDPARLNFSDALKKLKFDGPRRSTKLLELGHGLFTPCPKCPERPSARRGPARPW